MAFGDVSFTHRGLVLGDTLVVADLHVGRGRQAGLELPVGDGTDMLERFENLCRQFDPATVVIAGDLLHAFDTVSGQVRRTVDGFRDRARSVDADLVVTPGNHDTMLDAVWEGATSSEHHIGETVVCHGHVEPDGDAARYVIGHDHPTVTIEGRRRPCYLVGEGVYGDSDLLVMPAFNRLLRGVEINGMRARDFMSPLITDADALAPVVRDEDAGETLRFPPLGEFRHRL